jgi:thiol-disulfide isomerase/thioredoxin
MVAAGVVAYLAGQGEPPAHDAAPPSGVGWAEAPKSLPELGFQDAAQQRRTLADFRGKVVLLNVWATWCPPCREEMPSLDRLQQALGGADFEVVALSIDREGMAAVRRFYVEMGIRTLAPYVDPTMQAANTVRVIGLPTTLLLDRQGSERWRKTGPEKWDSPEIVEALRARMRKDRMNKERP